MPGIAGGSPLNVEEVHSLANPCCWSEGISGRMLTFVTIDPGSESQSCLQL